MASEEVAPQSRAFQRRAALYAYIDAQLRDKTRFFGAACLTNRVLAHLASRAGFAKCSVPTGCWLMQIGAVLETANIVIANSVVGNRLKGPALDRRIVALEQSIVEAAVRSGGSTPHFARILSELNVHLNYGCAAGWIPLRPELRWYVRVLSDVRAQLAVPLDFVVQSHREAIGMALILALQRK